MVNFGAFFDKAKSFAQKAVGKTGTVLKKIGQHTATAGRYVGMVAPHVSALATLAGEATGNKTLKTIGAVAGQVGAIAQTVAPRASNLMGMAGQSMENYGKGYGFGLTNHLNR
jgi:hypothetical protein